MAKLAEDKKEDEEVKGASEEAQAAAAVAVEEVHGTTAT